MPVLFWPLSNRFTRIDFWCYLDLWLQWKIYKNRIWCCGTALVHSFVCSSPLLVYGAVLFQFLCFMRNRLISKPEDLSGKCKPQSCTSTLNSVWILWVTSTASNGVVNLYFLFFYSYICIAPLFLVFTPLPLSFHFSCI